MGERIKLPRYCAFTPIADILGVSTGELLNGQRSQSAASEEIEKTIDNALVYAGNSKKMVSFQNIAAIFFSAVLLLGILVCSVCDLAISGTFSWSLYPIAAIIFAWFVLIPFVRYGSKGALGSLLIFSVLIIPFLYVLHIINGNRLMMPIGIRMSLYSIVYLWCAYFVFRKFKGRKLIAAAISILLAIPLCFMINISLAKVLSVSAFDLWDGLSFAMIAVVAAALFVIDHYRMRKR